MANAGRPEAALPGGAPAGEAAGRALDSEAEITLGLLSAVHENSALTQRSMARELGIALGLANAYLKRCVRKGYIKVRQAPPNRYAYYLTPQGFAEKTRLTSEYLSSSFQFFRRARSQCEALLADCAAHGRHRVALAGAGELAEIAALCALEREMKLVGIIDPKARADRILGLAVADHPRGLGAVDAILITDLRAPQATYERLRMSFPDDRLLAPRLLRILRGPKRLADSA